jgi:hypothetical protein
VKTICPLLFVTIRPLVKKDGNPKGQKRYYPRPKPEKEEVMKTTKTLKAMVLGCLIVICMHGYAAADENALVANVDNGTVYVGDAQDAEEAKPDVEYNTAEKGLGKETIGAMALGYAVAPWGAISVAITATTGLSMIYNALVPERNDKPENNTVVVLVANGND